MEIRHRDLGPDHPLTFDSMYSIAGVYAKQGQLTEAESLSAQVTEIRERDLGFAEPLTSEAMRQRASTYSL
jgi:hypothetical protein